jgi:hypothetical protein
MVRLKSFVNCVKWQPRLYIGSSPFGNWSEGVKGKMGVQFWTYCTKNTNLESCGGPNKMVTNWATLGYLLPTYPYCV